MNIRLFAFVLCVGAGLCAEAAEPAQARAFSGIPSVEVSPSGNRLWATWYAGPTGGENADNYVVLATSTDGGASWKEVFVADPDGAGPLRRFDPEVWVAPDGKLHWTFTERRCKKLSAEAIHHGGDEKTDRLLMVTLDPEREPKPGEIKIREIAKGVMMCKPTFLKDGTWLLPVARWYAEPSSCFYVSTDCGTNFTFRGGATLPKDVREFDEHRAVERDDGSLLAFIRAKRIGAYESVSKDGGRTWSKPVVSKVGHPNSRLFITRLKNGHLLLVKHGKMGEQPKGGDSLPRRELRAFVSTDGGVTWKGDLLIDDRPEISYPDGCQMSDGSVVVVYDRARYGAQAIQLCRFTEEDVLAGRLVSPASVLRRTVSARFRDVDCGRQLFVDDYLIASTNGVVRYWNHPRKEFDAPVLWPETLFECPTNPTHRIAPSATVNSSGLWWDPHKKVFRLWYEGGWISSLLYAESKDGVKWVRPDCGIVPGTNRILPTVSPDTWSVFPDYAAENPYANWRMMVSLEGGITDNLLFKSADGVHWESFGKAGQSGDCTTLFYDPFRSNWVYSLRDWRSDVRRCRRLWTSPTFGGKASLWSYPGSRENKGLPTPVKWLQLDAQDRPDPTVAGRRPELYNADAVAYESLMLGLFKIFHPLPGDNEDCVKAGMPKITDLQFAYSRDGVNFIRPDRRAAIPASRWGSGKWDTGYLSAVGGICVIRDERLWFYYAATRGDATTAKPKGYEKGFHWRDSGLHFNASIGAASLRRDGFVGMVADGRGELVTKPLVFTGGHLFVNAECRFGSVRAEVLDAAGQPLKGFTAEDCIPVAGLDATKRELVFKGGSLAALGKKGARIRFVLHCATLYSFWLSPSSYGESRGYLAAGGPDYPGLRDVR